MNEQEEFLSPQQSKLINFAIWAKYLAGVMLIVYIILAILVIPQDIILYQRLGGISNSLEYWGMISDNRLGYIVNVGSDILSTLFNGAMYYVVLKGISLGLYMIVETDINYREQKENGGEL